ncbi:MAG: DUF2807 domain-containing protein [Sphingobacteriales bacterium JAD_PAG50586_3]|nr:MAG: DUF2807 domain-containing protein [Sphingobacteriales bacterium JAD_PAG50586_3]
MIEIKGNGNIVSRELNVSTFIRLHLACMGRIELYQSDEEKVVIETDENLHEYFTATNAGRTLYVSMEANFRRPVFTACVIKVFLRQLDTLYVRNSRGDVFCPKEISLLQPLEIKVQSEGNTSLHFVAPSIKLLSQTQGNVMLKGACEKLDIKNQSEGDLDASQLMAGELTIKNMAQGNISLHADKSITIKHYGQGYVHYSGNAVVKDVVQYGDGEIKHINV